MSGRASLHPALVARGVISPAVAVVVEATLLLAEEAAEILLERRSRQSQAAKALEAPLRGAVEATTTTTCLAGLPPRPAVIQHKRS